MTIPVVSNVSCPSCGSMFGNQSALGVVYLYPVNCSSCNLSRVKSLVDGAGVPFISFMNDRVEYPNILMTYQNANVSISTIVRASNDFNVVSSLCLGKNQVACAMKERMSSSMQGCLNSNSIPLDSVIYYYSDWCGTLCNNMNSSLKKTQEAGFNIIWVNEKDDTPVKACLNEFLNYVGGVPQFICPKQVISNTGALSADGLQSFAEDCRA